MSTERESKLDSNEFERLLASARNGDRAAYGRVFESAYQELQTLARLARKRAHGASLDTTGLVHECYLRLIKAPANAANAQHFLAVAACAMRHLLIEHARARVMVKRGGIDAERTDFDEDELVAQSDARELLEMDDLLRKLALREPQQAAIVECRFFGGLSEQDTAYALDISVRSVQREWMRARQWLLAQGH